MARRRTKTSSFSTLGIPSDEELERFEMDYEDRFSAREMDLDFEERERKSRRAKRRRRKQGGERSRDGWYGRPMYDAGDESDSRARYVED